MKLERLKRNAIPALIAFILLMPGMLVDLTYSGKISCTFATILTEIVCTSARFLGLRYKTAFEVLKSNLGVLVTMVSLFLTMNVNIAERSEKKVFGISRSALCDQGMPRWCIMVMGSMRIVASLAPLLMVICIIEGFCVCGYELLMYCYVFLIVHYAYHSRTFKNEYILEQSSLYLKDSLKNSIMTEEGYINHQMLMNDFGQSVLNNAEWMNAERVYFRVAEHFIISEDSKIFLAFGHFFKKGFVENSYEKSMYLIREYITEMDSGLLWNNSNGLEYETRAYMILWSMLCSWMESVPENILLDFLKWFLQFDRRSQINIQGGYGKIEQKLLDRQSLMLILLLERWLETNTPKNRETIDNILSLFTYSKNALSNDECFWDNLAGLYLETERTEYRVFEKYQTYLESFNIEIHGGKSNTVIASILAAM